VEQFKIQLYYGATATVPQVKTFAEITEIQRLRCSCIKQYRVNRTELLNLKRSLWLNKYQH